MLTFHIPDNELEVDFARSSGPGGQNVNKASTKAQARWCVGASAVLSDEEKARVRSALATRLTQADEIIVSAESERSQLQNKITAIARLEKIISAALMVPKIRRSTRPTYSSRLKKQETKKRISKIKKSRRLVIE